MEEKTTKKTAKTAEKTPVKKAPAKKVAVKKAMPTEGEEVVASKTAVSRSNKVTKGPKIDLNKTLYKNPQELEKTRKRYKIDASGKTLGKLAVTIADLLIGKNEAYNCDFWDCGGFVVVENADKIHVTGKKLGQKIYYSYSGYKGNLKSKTLKVMLDKKPTDPLWLAVRGMLPKNKLRDRRMKRLKMFTTASAKYDFLHPIVIN